VKIYFCELAPLYLSQYCTFVGATSFWGIKLIALISCETKLHIQKYGGLENIEKPSRTLEATLGSSTDINLGHLENVAKLTHISVRGLSCMTPYVENIFRGLEKLSRNRKRVIFPKNSPLNIRWRKPVSSQLCVCARLSVPDNSNNKKTRTSVRDVADSSSLPTETWGYSLPKLVSTSI
jgi:hypothetical protein